MIGTVSSCLVSSYTPIPHSLALGQRLSTPPWSCCIIEFLLLLIEPYRLGTYLALLLKATVIVRTPLIVLPLLLFVLSRLSPLLSCSFLLYNCYCLAFSEAQTIVLLIAATDST